MFTKESPETQEYQRDFSRLFKAYTNQCRPSLWDLPGTKITVFSRNIRLF